jgi:hypothetical protein
MPSQAVAEADRTTGVIASAPWRIKALMVLPGYRLAVTLQDGTKGVADLSALASDLDRGIYDALRDATYFAQARIELGAVTWPNGADLDPAWMYDELKIVETWSVPEVSPQIRPPELLGEQGIMIASNPLVQWPDGLEKIRDGCLAMLERQ